MKLASADIQIGVQPVAYDKLSDERMGSRRLSSGSGWKRPVSDSVNDSPARSGWPCNGDMGVCHTLRGTGGKYGLSACWTRKGLLRAVLQRLHLMSQLHSASRTNAALNSLRQGPASLDDPTEAE